MVSFEDAKRESRRHNELLIFEDALRQSRRHNELLISVLKQQLKEEELMATEHLRVERASGEVWDLEVVDAVPLENGVRLMGEARRIK